jgi:hypothetical protein
VAHAVEEIAAGDWIVQAGVSALSVVGLRGYQTILGCAFESNCNELKKPGPCENVPTPPKTREILRNNEHGSIKSKNGLRTWCSRCRLQRVKDRVNDTANSSAMHHRIPSIHIAERHSQSVALSF